MKQIFAEILVEIKNTATALNNVTYRLLKINIIFHPPLFGNIILQIISKADILTWLRQIEDTLIYSPINRTVLRSFER